MTTLALVAAGTPSFSNTIGLGTIILSVLILVVAGFPARLLKQLREERVELMRLNKEQAEELRENDRTIAELSARPDMTTLADQNHELHVATIAAIQDIAAASLRESDLKLDKLEAAVAGGMAANTKELHKVATLLDRVATRLDVNNVHGGNS